MAEAIDFSCCICVKRGPLKVDCDWTVDLCRFQQLKEGYLIVLFLILQTKLLKPSDAPPKISIGVPWVIFQGGSFLIP